MFLHMLKLSVCAGTVCVQQLQIFQALQKYPSVSFYKSMIVDSSSFVGLEKCACFPPNLLFLYNSCSFIFYHNCG